MRLEKLCVLELQYVDEFHYVSPYAGESGVGWGHGVGTATGDRLSGRTVFVEHDGETVGRQLLLTLFEAEHDDYRWLNQTVCITEGAIDPVRRVMRMEVHLCHPDLT